MKFNNLNEILAFHAENSKNKTLFNFLKNIDDKVSITYGEFYQKVKSISSQLQEKTTKGERVLLLYPPGIEFITAFFGCLNAGVIAVPAYAPNKRNISKLEGIIQDAGIKMALCNQSTLALIGVLKLNKKIKQEILSKIDLVHLDDTRSDLMYNEVEIEPNSTAFLQYTSGSTSFPKGVMVTHENLISNSETIKNVTQVTSDSHMVSWLPPFHDMGLIGKIIQTIYSGISATLMAPITFIKKPSIWLEAISQNNSFDRIVSGAPNFAFDLCVDKIREEDLSENFDLSHWKIAFSGAEPVRKKTIERFYQKFKKYGFQYKQLLPVYGLAESTLMATSGNIEKEPIVKRFSLDKIEEDQKAVEEIQNGERDKFYVACGEAIPHHIVVAVNPETMTFCEEKEIGEIWIKGDSVAKGYWNKEALTDERFRAYTQCGEGPFFRTGDMGFFNNKEIYITGRIKDMIIINGRNYYPEDVEVSVAEAHDSLKKGGTATISIDENGTEKVIVVQEIKKDHVRNYNKEEIVSAIKRAVRLKHDLVIDAIVLISTSSIPKTTSGKIQRFNVKKQFLKNELNELDAWPTRKVVPIAA